MLNDLRLYLRLRPDLDRLKGLLQMKLSINVIGQILLVILQMGNQLSGFVPPKYQFSITAFLAFVQLVLGILAHLKNPDGSPASLPNGLNADQVEEYKRIFSGSVKAIAFLLVAGLAAPSYAQQPVPDTVISTGIVSNLAPAYRPAPYVSAGTLLSSSTATFPTFGGIRYELYRDDAGKPAYAGLAWVKVIIFHKNRYFCFAEPGIGGAGTASDISSALQLGGGCGLQIGHFSSTNTPHWEFFVEPQARRVPALDNGTQKAFIAGFAYSFNRPH